LTKALSVSSPLTIDPLPVTDRRGPTLRQASHRLFDFRQTETKPLRDEDEAQPPDIRSPEAPLVAGSSFGPDQALAFVKPDG